MEQQIESLAAQMGVTVADVRGFVDCLRLWIAKGYSFEQAIERHMQQMRRLVNNASEIAKAPDVCTAMANEVWDALNVPA